MTNADRLFESYMDGGYYYKKSDKLKVYDNTDIYDGNTLLGKIEDLECSDYRYRQFVILNMQFYKTHKVSIRQLVKAANKIGYYVLFVDSLDIGFGERKVDEGIDIHMKRLLDVYKMSNSEYRKNALAVVDNHYDDWDAYTKGLYTMRQRVNDEETSAAEVLYWYMTAENKTITPHRIFAIRNMTAGEVCDLLEAGVYTIYYCHYDDSIVTEVEKEQMDKIMCKQIKSINDLPVYYDKLNVKLIDKFFAKEEQ